MENIISALIERGFLKEERFAAAFAGGKFRIKKWGRIKIRRALQEKRVSDPLISKALKEIDDMEYRKTIKEIIRVQSKKIIQNNVFKKNNKIASYLISRGYEPELVWAELKSDFE